MFFVKNHTMHRAIMAAGRRQVLLHNCTVQHLGQLGRPIEVSFVHLFVFLYLVQVPVPPSSAQPPALALTLALAQPYTSCMMMKLLEKPFSNLTVISLSKSNSQTWLHKILKDLLPWLLGILSEHRSAIMKV